MLLGETEDVELDGELEVVIELVTQHRVVVELETLQGEDEGVGQLPEVAALGGADLLAQLLGVVHVVAVQDVGLDEKLQGLRETLLAFNVEGYRKERLYSFLYEFSLIVLC